MERRDEGGRPRGMQNYTTQMPPQMSQDSLHPVVKLPLAPIVSTPLDRRGNNAGSAAPVSTRRGSSIFSPTTQTLDHHLPPPPPPPPPPLKLPNPDPDPVHLPLSSSGPTNLRNPEENQNQNQNQTSSSTTPQSTAVIRYRECLKNHAASMGGHVVDGCGEFMPNGDDGTAESLRCAACDCHRNFHRKEVEDPNGTTSHSQLAATTPYQTPPPPNHHHHHHIYNNNDNNENNSSKQGRGGNSYPQMVNFGGGGGGESSSEDLNMYQQTTSGGSKKRFRTKFSQEQKDKMNDFAERMGWRMQKQNEAEVQQFCSEVGVKRQVFKVWMHNNKQAIKKKQT